MPDAELFRLIVAAVIAVIGVIIFWSNPARTVSRCTALSSLHVSAWMVCVYMSRTRPHGSEQALWWFRLCWAVGASIPLEFKLVKESIVGSIDWSRRAWKLTLVGWIGLLALLTAICFTDYFIPPNSTAAHRVYGWGYQLNVVANFALYGWLLFDAMRALHRLTGVRRLELQVWLVGGCAMALIVLTLMLVSLITRDYGYIAWQSAPILIFFSGAVWAITTHRIFDARHIVLWTVQKLILLTGVTAVAYGIENLVDRIAVHGLALAIALAISLAIAVELNRWLSHILALYPHTTIARRAALAIAQQGSDWQRLTSDFRRVLEGWSNSGRAIIDAAPRQRLVFDGEPLPDGGAVIETLRALQWATPERLARERPTSGRQEVARFLERHRIGAVVLSEGPSLSAIVGVGVNASRLPYTFPQSQQLLEISSIIESALERAHFSAKAQHAEQLATVGLLGASVAHEIQNPLVAIRTFVQLLPAQHDNPAFREKFFRLIGEEVQRVDHLTKQLLELASPRLYTAAALDLHPVVTSAVTLVEAKAAERAVTIHTELAASPDRVWTDAAAVKQVVLNLCFNAIQTMEQTAADRRAIWVKTRRVHDGVELTIADAGPGIAPEARAHLFEPFHTTKAGGFGLGLAICRDIMQGLGATITVDPPAAAGGATFRILLPFHSAL